MSNAVVLLRVSTKAQAESNNGLRAQRSACLAYAESNGLNVLEVITEGGVSGAAPIDKRVGLIRALSLLGEDTVLLVAKYDRLSRVLLSQLTLERTVANKKSSIIAVDNESASNDDPSSVLLRRLLSSVAEYEREIIKGRIISAHKARKQAGLTCGHPPYGYAVGDDDMLVPNPKEQKVWSVVQQLRKTPYGKKSGHPWRAVAEKLNEQGYVNRSGGVWKLHNLFVINKTKETYKGL
jgi:DNA invertase Pin-like site-specific DNA recombinase